MNTIAVKKHFQATMAGMEHSQGYGHDPKEHGEKFAGAA